MPNYLDFQLSIAQEFKAYENRVRFLIDDSNWAEEGRYKEIILMNYLRRNLPQNFSVGTGFVRNNLGEITGQIDIIIYKNTYPLFFSEGDFIICNSDSVVGIIEVKTRIRPSTIVDVIKKSNNNGKIIVDKSSKKIFNGIFSYNIDGNIETYKDNIEKLELQNSRVLQQEVINNIALGDFHMITLLNYSEHQKNLNGYLSYNVFNLEFSNKGLAFSYFLSNLLDIVYRQSAHFSGKLPNEYEKMIFPIVESERKIEEIHVNVSSINSINTAYDND